MGCIRKALEKDYVEHPRSACGTDEIFEIFVRFGHCLCCLLPVFVNRQLPCLHTNSRHMLLLPPMHHNSIWCTKEHALALQPGCRLLIRCPLAQQKSLVLPTCSHLHEHTRSMTF